MNEDNLLVELIDSINKIVRNKSNEKEFIPLHEPSFLNTKAKSNVNDCIDSGWVSSAGTWVNNFEHALWKFSKMVPKKFRILLFPGWRPQMRIS